MFLLICEMMVTGMNSMAVPANLQKWYASFTGVEAEEIPSLNCVCKCRVVPQNLNESLSMFRLDNSTSGHLMFTAGTTRSQIAFQHPFIALLENVDLGPVVVLSCMCVENETSEQCVQSILETVSQIHILVLSLKSNMYSHK